MAVRLHLVSSPDDDGFIERLQRGDVTTRGTWFDQEYPRISALVLRLVGPRVDVADLVHDVFLQAFRSVTSFEGTGVDLRAWLTGVTVRVVRGHLRKWRVRRILQLWDDAEDETRAIATPDASPSARAAVLRTWALLDGFPSEERLAFSLRYFSQLELTEIADAMQVSLSTAKRRVDAARRRFMTRASNDPLLAGWGEAFEP